MKKQKFQTKFGKNLDMNGDTYRLRSRVMELVREAKDLLGGDMPRVSVRIMDSGQGGALGAGRMGRNVIWIDADTVGENRLRHVVYHELCHALWAVEHDPDCPLMRPQVGPEDYCGKEQCQKLFKKYAEANGRGTFDGDRGAVSLAA